MVNLSDVQVGFIGAGQMAQAIAKAIVSKGIISSSQIRACAPSERNNGPWEALGIEFSHDNSFVYSHSDIVFLAMKPQQVNEKLYAELSQGGEKCKKRKIFVSLLAGVTLETLTSALSPFNANYTVVRTVPNTPMQVGEGCCLYSVAETEDPLTKEELALVDTLLSAGGVTLQVAESSLNAFGALTGSAPAFICMILEGLSDGAVKMGIPRAQATRFAAQMALGTAKMVLESDKHIAELRESVTSPGGTTIRGIHALERRAVRSAMMEAIEVTTVRANEMGAAKK